MSRADELWAGIRAGGAAFVRGLIAQSTSEELYLDYKRSANNGATTALDNGDRATLAKAISGFGNSAGGVVVWGVDCRPRSGRGDVPEEAPIADVARFRSLIESASAHAAVPAHRGVISAALPFDLQCPNGPGFVATFIPSSDDAPHQVPDKGCYYIRAGSSFSPTPHSVLSGMFGRRPQPWVIPKYLIGTKLGAGSNNSIEVHLGILLQNHGRGIARDIFANLTVDLPGPNCQLGLDQSSQTRDWSVNVGMGRWINILSKPDVRLAPGGMQIPVVVLLVLRPPFDCPLLINGHIGCEGGAPCEGDSVAQRDEVEAFYTYQLQLPVSADRRGGPTLVKFNRADVEAESVNPS